MKNLIKTTPSLLVSNDEYRALKDGTTRTISLPLDKKILRYLPKAYEDATGTVLVFPVKECPTAFRFRTLGEKEQFSRRVFNIMAYKMEDGSEIVKIRFK